MRKIFSYLSLSIALLFFNSLAYAKHHETVSVPLRLDNKSWVFGSQTRMGTFYVPKGQTVQHWNELITVQYYPNYAKASAKEFMNHFLAHLHKNEPKVKSKYLSSSLNNAVAEWSISNSKTCPDQYGLERVVKGPQALHIIHYAVKTKKWPQSDHNKWLNIINKTTVRKAE